MNGGHRRHVRRRIRRSLRCHDVDAGETAAVEPVLEQRATGRRRHGRLRRLRRLGRRRRLQRRLQRPDRPARHDAAQRSRSARFARFLLGVVGGVDSVVSVRHPLRSLPVPA